MDPHILYSPYHPLPSPDEFPEVGDDNEGIVAIGTDLSTERLVEAYSKGIFPWYNEGMPVLWWSLDPRMVMKLDDFRYSDSLRRIVKSGRYEVRIDSNFEQVINACATTHGKTWITDEMREAYIELHQYGVAHSFETYRDGELVGGLYGVSLGRMFSGESMFHTESNASKVAFARLVSFCQMHHFHFIDAQQPTPHLASLGAMPIKRKLFLEILRNSLSKSSLIGKWHNHTAVLLIGSNQGSRIKLIDEAIKRLSELGDNVTVSDLYETEPWGFDHPTCPFLNISLMLDTELSPTQLLEQTQAIEKELGRLRDTESTGYQSRTMDIDIIFIDGLILNQPNLQIPHPRAHQRNFVLTPLTDIIPNYAHPTLRKTIAELQQICPDKSEVKKISRTN